MSSCRCRWGSAVLAALGGWAGLQMWAQTAATELRVTVGRSAVIDYPRDIARISTSNPEVVDAVAASTREILLHARSYGTATVVVWSKNGDRSFYDIKVDHDLEPLRKILAATFPGEDIQVESAKDSIALTGTVSSKAVAEHAGALASAMAKTVVSNLGVREMVEKQILLRVKFAEMDRSLDSNFAVNLVSTGAANTPGRITTGQFAAPSFSDLAGSIPGRSEGASSRFTVTDALNVFAFRPDLNLAAFVAALQSRGYLQILAQPNLVTSDRKEASFLVGGEFPVPVLQGGANAGAVTIQFREFGIRLTFTPELTANDTIKMYVKPEVSTIDISNAVSFNGFTIPALATRRMETNIELGEGQSFVIAGLMDDRARESFSRIPGLSHVPILGEMFKSREKAKSKSELIVMVTPEIVEALEPAEAEAAPVMPIEFLEPFQPDASLDRDGKVKERGGAEARETGKSSPPR